MRHAVFLGCSALVGTLVGCSPPQAPPGPVTTARSLATAAPANPVPVDRMILCVRLAMVDLPVGAASDAEDIWARLQGAPIDPRLSKALQANGLRVGLGAGRNLVDLAGVLQGLTGRAILYASVPSLLDSPSSVTLREDQPPATIFMVDRDGAASGTDFPAGDYLLAIGGRLNSEDPSRILLTAVPQIRFRSASTTIVRTDGRLGFQTRRPVFSFEEVAITVEMPVKDVLVIGPSRGSRRPSSIGHGFFTGSRAGLPFETVILLIPELIVASSR
ncbi:MAG: hypothetical protein MUP47_11515 [Phycisphaerae bacterium]|nr:hypothetical protein [Phycisphaerae bacterium]